MEKNGQMSERNKQLANIFTKALKPYLFHDFLTKMGVQNLHMSSLGASVKNIVDLPQFVVNIFSYYH